MENFGFGPKKKIEKEDPGNFEVTPDNMLVTRESDSAEDADSVEARKKEVGKEALSALMNGLLKEWGQPAGLKLSKEVGKGMDDPFEYQNGFEQEEAEDHPETMKERVLDDLEGFSKGKHWAERGHNLFLDKLMNTGYLDDEGLNTEFRNFLIEQVKISNTYKKRGKEYFFP